MTRNPKHHLLAATVLLLPVVALGACSDSDTGSKSSSSGASGGSSTTADKAKPADAASGGNAVTIQDFTFKPGDLKVAVGTKVTFTNKDGFAHTVTAKDNAFASGNIDPEATFEHTFDTAGAFPFHCSIHNSMTGTITVS